MKDLTTGKIHKTFILFAIPVLLSSLLSQAYATINTVLAGKLLGDVALAATGSISPLDTFFNSVFWGYGMGIGIYVSQLFGAKNYLKLKSVVVSNLGMLSIVIAALSACFVIFRYDVYGFLNIDPEILEDCNRYFVIIICGKMFLLFGVNCVTILHALGESGFSLAVSFLSSTINCVVGALFVTTFGMGVEGLALSSVISSVNSFVIYLFKLSSIFKKMGVHKEKTPISFTAIRDTGKYSLTTMIQQSVMYFAGLLLSPMINGIGGAASASYSVTLRIFDINNNIYISSSKVVGSYTAQCYGAKKYDQLKKGLRAGAVQSLCLLSPILLACCLFAPNVAGMFYPEDADPVSVEYSIVFFRYFLPFIVFNLFANLFHNFFRGIGRMKALLITTLAGSAARIVISWILIQFYGIYGYYVGWVFMWIADAAVGAGIYFFGKWRKQLRSELDAS